MSKYHKFNEKHIKKFNGEWNQRGQSNGMDSISSILSIFFLLSISCIVYVIELTKHNWWSIHKCISPFYSTPQKSFLIAFIVNNKMRFFFFCPHRKTWNVNFPVFKKAKKNQIYSELFFLFPWYGDHSLYIFIHWRKSSFCSLCWKFNVLLR